MKITALLLMMMAIPAINAQAGTKIQVYNMGAFNEGALVFLAADTVNIRSTPAIGNNIIDNLPVGYQVKVEKKSDLNYNVDGLKAPWYQVSYSSSKGPVRGYVWGGFLSIAALPVQYDGKQALILFTIKSAKNIGTIPVQAMIACGGKIVSKTGFDAIGILSDDRMYGYNISAELFGSRGFTGVSNVITLDFNYPACGYPFGIIVIIYNGAEIICGPYSLNTIESGVFHSLEKFVFPDEKGGVRNSLVSIKTHEDFDEVKKNYVLKKTTKTTLTWTGRKFEDMK